MPSSTLTDDQVRILQGSQESRIIATSYYDGRSTFEGDLPVVGGQVDDDGDADVTRSLSLLIADADGSLVPRDYKDPLSPYGSQLFIQTEHKLGDYSTRIPIGWFQIHDLPDFQEQKDRYRTGEYAHRGAAINVKARGLFQINKDERFEAPARSNAGLSTYDEAARLSRIPITRSLADKPIRAAIDHGETPLDALAVLAENLDGIGYETADGTWSVRPKVPSGVSVWELAYGTSGGIVTPPRSLTREGFANAWIVRNESNSSGPQVQGRATIEAGPLAYGGPMGRVPRFVNNPLMNTNAAAKAAAETLRDQELRGKPFTLKISCVPNPTLIPGDTVTFDYFGTELDGVIVKTSLPHLGMQSLELTVNPGGDPWV